jgi:EpsI family protein
MVRSSTAKSRPFVHYGLLAAACLILVLQASASRMLKVDERTMPIPGLHDLPRQLESWKNTGDESMDPAAEAWLKPDEYILRDYVDQQHDAKVNLFVAYFKSTQNAYGPHSPSVCLPGAGWLVTSHRIANIPVPGRPDGIPANQFTMEKQNQRILVLYWYQNDRDIWAQEFQAKLRLLPNLLRYHRSDVSLVRLITPLQGALADNELNFCFRFTRDLFPPLAQRFASVH